MTGRTVGGGGLLGVAGTAGGAALDGGGAGTDASCGAAEHPLTATAATAVSIAIRLRADGDIPAIPSHPRGDAP